MELCVRNNILGMNWTTKKKTLTNKGINDRRIVSRIFCKPNNKPGQIIYKQISLVCMCFGATIVPWRNIKLHLIAYPQSTLRSLIPLLFCARPYFLSFCHLKHRTEHSIYIIYRLTSFTRWQMGWNNTKNNFTIIDGVAFFEELFVSNGYVSNTIAHLCSVRIELKFAFHCALRNVIENYIVVSIINISKEFFAGCLSLSQFSFGERW